ncbi:MAG: hypothetical protein HUJ98_10685 [Bacteroidaceae bacterium]|nr:hypothetical protein [Bacteroidaceae bacterium]
MKKSNLNSWTFMVEDSYISRVFDDLKLRYDRISVVTNLQRLKRQLKADHPDVEFLSSTSLPPSIDEAQVAFKDYDCAIFTAFRGGNTLEQNKHRNELLKADIVSEGLVYRPVNGCYREVDWVEPNVEICFFVYKSESEDSREFFRKAYRLSEKYEQDSFLYKRSGVNKAAFLIATNDSCRSDYHSDIKFAGVLYLRVPNVDAWTDCSDGRIAFLQKGLILKGTNNKKIKFGEGNVFDIEGYKPDGIVVLYDVDQSEFADLCKDYSGEIPMVKHVFKKKDYTQAYIHDVIFSSLKKLRDQKCKRIGFHCSVSIDGSPLDGVAAAYEAIKLWVKRYDKKFDWIVIVDTYGDYCKLLKGRD